MRAHTITLFLVLHGIAFARPGVELNVNPSAYVLTSIEDASGPAHRRVALNGRPIPEGKPQTKGESDEKPALGAFIDAFNLNLNLTLTDIYVPSTSGELALAVKRNVREEVWSLRRNLLPADRPDRPFGLGWSSNIVVSIEFVRQQSGGPLARGADYAYVTDEQGAVHRFLILTNPFNLAEVYLPLPSSGLEQETFLTTLEGDGQTYTFKKPHGTTLIFEKTGLNRNVWDWFVGESEPLVEQKHRWARVKKITNRLGESLTYAYAQMASDSSQNALIPANIALSNGAGGSQVINITSANGLVTAVSDPMSKTFYYKYTTQSPDIKDYTKPWAVPGGVPIKDFTYKVLTSTTNRRGHLTHYSYNELREDDFSNPSHWKSNAPTEQYHCNLASIRNPGGGLHQFAYKFDHTRHVTDIRNHGTAYQNHAITGLPCKVWKVTLPTGGITTFTDNSSMTLGIPQNGEGPIAVGFVGVKEINIVDAENSSVTYNFFDEEVKQLSAFHPIIAHEQFYSWTAPYIVMFKKMTISYPQGVETFTFDPAAGLALETATDFFGNVTRFTHDDAWSLVTNGWWTDLLAIGSGVTVYPFSKYPDPNAQITALGTKTFSYGDFRLLETSRDANLRDTIYTLDLAGRTSKEEIIYGGTLKSRILYTYHTEFRGFVTSKRIQKLTGDPDWAQDQLTVYEPDYCGRVKSESVYFAKDKFSETTFTYDLNNNRTSVTDPNLNKTLFSYNGEDQLVRITHPATPALKIKEFGYDTAGNKSFEINERGVRTSFGYDGLNRLIKKTVDAGGVLNLLTSYVYDHVDSIRSIRDPSGSVTTRAYDSLQRLTSEADALQNTTTYEYIGVCGSNMFESTRFKPTKVTDASGFSTTTTYDVLYRPVTISKVYTVGGAISTLRNTYDGVGNITEIMDPLLRTTTMEYDALNRLTKTIFPNNKSVTRVYTSSGLLWQTIDELNRVTETIFDWAGRPVKVIGDATGVKSETKTSYDNAGNVVSVMNPLNKETQYVYDQRNRRIKDIYPKPPNASVNPVISRTYNGIGDVVSVTDPLKRTTVTEYDRANRVFRILQPAVIVNGKKATPITKSLYDRNGNLTDLTDANGALTENFYDKLNRLTKTVQTPTSGKPPIIVRRSYDEVGNMVSLTDGEGAITGFAYDGLRRNTKVTDASLAATEYEYDALNKIRRTDSRTQITEYDYDLRNRLAFVRFLSRPIDNRQYSYDAVGNLLNVQATSPNASADSSVFYEYDGLNRVVKEKSADSEKHEYVYDAAGNRTKVIYGKTGRIVTSTYDALNRLRKVEDGTRKTAYLYDLAGNRISMTKPNGEEVTHSYDALNRLIQINGHRPGENGADGPLDYSYMQSYDLVGNMISKAEVHHSSPSMNREISMGYDRTGRLVTEQTVAITDEGPRLESLSYKYDKANNRTKLTKEVSAPNP